VILPKAASAWNCERKKKRASDREDGSVRRAANIRERSGDHGQVRTLLQEKNGENEEQGGSKEIAKKFQSSDHRATANK